jgi:signal transduction histidine kinase
MAAPKDLDLLREFFRLEEEDLKILSDLRPAIEEHADELVDEFYRHLIGFQETQDFLRDPEIKQQLLVKQREYLLSLTDPKIDAEYAENRLRIGATHERIGLDTRWYLGAYALYFSQILPVIRSSLRHDPIRAERATSALVKRLILDAELAIQHYITRREEDLRHLNQELSSASRALSREMDETSENLKRSEARARAAEELASVATLVSGLAHEVGTPMGVIRGHAEALDRSVQDARGQWRLRIILEQIDRITTIIQSLLNIARPKESLYIAVDLPELIETTLSFLTEKLRRRHVTVDKKLNASPEISGDPEKMQQLFLNLFINAIDAMPEGGVLGVRLEEEEDEVTICVSDTGTGIPPENLKNIFDPFYTTKAAGVGNGLGLVVVKRIVSDHGGQISADSEPGRGTRFEMRLPIQSS